jgi:hypothetical protein
MNFIGFALSGVLEGGQLDLLHAHHRLLRA